MITEEQYQKAIQTIYQYHNINEKGRFVFISESKEEEIRLMEEDLRSGSKASESALLELQKLNDQDRNALDSIQEKLDLLGEKTKSL